MSRRRVVQTPQSRRDIAEILGWYEETMGAKAALRAAATFRNALTGIRSGNGLGTPIGPAELGLRRVLARQHLVIFRDDGGTVQILRVVHGARDIEAIIASLDD